MKRLFVGAILLLACGVVVVTLFRNDMGPRTSGSTLILNRLRAIDAAKSGWAAEHPDAKGRNPAEQDLAPLLQQLHHNMYFFDRPVAGEEYLIHGLSEPAEAKLTKQVDNLPANGSVRWGPDGDIQVRTNLSLPWPNERSGVDAGRPFLFALERRWPGTTHRER
jgi:hypothetical protein